MRTCGQRCWWAKSDQCKCKCTCGGKKHGIMLDKNSNRLQELFEEVKREHRMHWKNEVDLGEADLEEAAKTWRQRHIIREKEAAQ